MIKKNLEDQIKEGEDEIIERLKTIHIQISTNYKEVLSMKHMDEAVPYLQKKANNSDLTRMSAGLYWFFRGQKDRAREIWSKIDSVEYLTKDNLLIGNDNRILLWTEDIGLKIIKDHDKNLTRSLMLYNKSIIAHDAHQVFDIPTMNFISSNEYFGLNSLLTLNRSLIGCVSYGSTEAWWEGYNISTQEKLYSLQVPHSYDDGRYDNFFVYKGELCTNNKLGIYTIDGRLILSPKQGKIDDAIVLKNKLYYVECIKDYTPTTQGLYYIYDDTGEIIAERVNGTSLHVSQNKLFDTGGKEFTHYYTRPIIETLTDTVHNIYPHRCFVPGDEDIFFADQEYTFSRYELTTQKKTIISNDIRKFGPQDSDDYNAIRFKIQDLM
jgi:hypothetical protein